MLGPMDDFFTPKNIVLTLAGFLVVLFVFATLPFALDMIF